MHMSNESLLVILFVGIVAGWLAGHIVQGTGFGLIGDLFIGIIGAFIGERFVPQLGIHLGTGILSAIIDATIGAIPFLLIIRLIRGPVVLGSRWSRLWGTRW
ncbi:MAG TPA: GlsB/YeaQ/YmgE family stress response membrane protein [Rhizomicrobium sp.]|nr:GlsB/YeaQ/YmgE family stress response membrane protein [Rhizomicrobium sp.]